jgi:hypothetical protein
MRGPKRVIIEYEDGTRREAQFDTLSKPTQKELSALKAPSSGPMQSPASYVLLQWKDGWKEVIAVDESALDLLRYYTIERVEEIGRLSLNTTDGIPQLLIVKRLAGSLKSIMLVGDNVTQSYSLEEKVTVKEGGKVEHFFYDKKRPNFSMDEASTASERFGTILEPLRSELQKKGLNGPELRSMSVEERVRIYTEIAKVLSLKGTERQSDVYGFIQLAIEKLAAPK